MDTSIGLWLPCMHPPPQLLFHNYLFGVCHHPQQTVGCSVLVTTTLGAWQSAPTRLCLSFKKCVCICQARQMFPYSNLWCLWLLGASVLGMWGGTRYLCSVALSLVCRSSSLYSIGNHFVGFLFGCDDQTFSFLQSVSKVWIGIGCHVCRKRQ